MWPAAARYGCRSSIGRPVSASVNSKCRSLADPTRACPPSSTRTPSTTVDLGPASSGTEAGGTSGDGDQLTLAVLELGQGLGAHCSVSPHVKHEGVQVDHGGQRDAGEIAAVGEAVERAVQVRAGVADHGYLVHLEVGPRGCAVVLARAERPGGGCRKAG